MHFSIDQGLDEQANSDAANKAAMNYIAKCKNKGYPWCKFDGEDVKFLYVAQKGLEKKH